jgi:hypothetical protein
MFRGRVSGGDTRKKKRKKKRGGRKKMQAPGPSRFRRRPVDYCVCPACGARVPRRGEVACYLMSCPKCGGTMTKEKKGPELQGAPEPEEVAD